MPKARLFPLSVVEYGALLGRQRFRCAICKRRRKLAVDHDHKTGAVRGLLCFTCNYDIISYHRCAAPFREQAKLWAAAAAYMDRHYGRPPANLPSKTNPLLALAAAPIEKRPVVVRYPTSINNRP